MSEPRYFIGIDPIGDSRSKAALVTLRQNPDGSKEVVKVLSWWRKFEWFQRLKFKFYIWCVKRFYKNVIVVTENPEALAKLRIE